jgi:YesN/AraC family two-component response regulator
MLVFLYRNYREHFPAASASSSMDTILSIQKYIEDNYNENITLNKLSRLFYTDMYYLSHQFRKLTGFTFKEYLILQRISRAKDLLLYTSDDITQVGLNSGFNCVNHFIRMFKKTQGITPLQYRKKHQNEQSLIRF